MSVKVRLSTLLRPAADWQEFVQVEAKTPAGCIVELEARYPEITKWIRDRNGRMWGRFQLFINGRALHPEGLEQELKDDDELFLLLNIGGG